MRIMYIDLNNNEGWMQKKHSEVSFTKIKTATIINLLPVLRHNHNHVDIETGIFLRFTMQIPKETGMQYIMSACLYINIEYELGEFVSQ